MSSSFVVHSPNTSSTNSNSNCMYFACHNWETKSDKKTGYEKSIVCGYMIL